MTIEAVLSQLQPPAEWTQHHLLGLETLTTNELMALLDTAAELKRLTNNCSGKAPLLAGRTSANLFFENSTRTAHEFLVGGSAPGR